MVEEHEMREKDAELNLRGFYAVDPFDFYRDVFPIGSFERLGCQEDRKSNGLALSIGVDLDTGKSRGSYTILTDGLEQLEDLWKHPFAIIAPISYFGRSRKASNASLLYALALDIDYVGADNLCHLLDVRFQDEPGYGCLPRPTYVANSGHGVHLYYLLDRPVPMYPDNQRELLRLKRFLVDLIWDKYVSYRPERKECLGLVQGFRMVGGASKVQGTVRAYKTGKRCSVSWLESFDRTGKLALEIKDSRELALADAAELYPDWYERVVVRGERAGIPNWRPKRDLYDWWKRRVTDEARYGHRYFCIMALAVFATKCGIERDELESDALALREEITDRGDEPLTEDDVFAALEAYNEDMRTFPRKDIERITAVPMPANKRNWRNQEQHVKIMTAIRDILYPDGSWRNKNGAPTKERLVKDYANAHPRATQREIAQATGVSLPTVNKWMRESPR